MSASATTRGPGTFYDGVTARPHAVTVTAESPGIVEIGAGDGEPMALWPRENIRMVEAPAGLLRMRLEPDDGARLEVSEAMLAQTLTASCPALNNREALDRSMRWKIVGWSIAACISVVLLAVYGVPAIAERLVPLIPEAVDRQIGAGVRETLVRQLTGGAECKPGPEADAAFRTLTERLLAHAGAAAKGANIAILPSGVRNALALPGGHVMILSGLIEDAKSADELAGVLAHELGHVARRHSMRKLVSEAGLYFLLGVLLGDFSGSTVIIAGGRTALSAGFSRDAERDADDYAIKLMGRAGGDPAALATLLERIASVRVPNALGFLATHPLTPERVADIRVKADAVRGGKPANAILGDGEWRALKTYCAVTS